MTLGLLYNAFSRTALWARGGGEGGDGGGYAGAGGRAEEEEAMALAAGDAQDQVLYLGLRGYLS